jgi:seryl-tRNA synthetase
MLDAPFIREHLNEVRANCRNRNVRAEVDRVVHLDDERKHLVQETQTLQQRRNDLSKFIPKEKDPARKQALIHEGQTLREQIASLETRLKQTETDLRAVLLTIPNMSHPDAPVGTTAEDNKVLRRWGEPRKFDFPAKDHVALGEALDLIASAAARISSGE